MGTIITGASGVLGRAVVASLAARGDDVVAIDRMKHPELPATVKQIICEDLADEALAAEVVAAAMSEIGSLKTLVLIAGGFAWARVDEAPVELWRTMFRDNLETTLVPLRAALRSLDDGASIVCIGAHSAQSAGEGMGPYAASKSAVARLVEALAHELKPRLIRVNAILPGTIDTPRNRADMPDADFTSWTSPAAISDVVAFLTSNAARAINGALIPTTNRG